MPATGVAIENRTTDVAPGVDLRAARLAELVAELTGCGPAGALHAVKAEPLDVIAAGGDPLEVVARAMLHVDRPDPEGFRVTGFLRDDLVIDCRDEPASVRLPQRVVGRLPRRQPLP